MLGQIDGSLGTVGPVVAADRQGAELLGRVLDRVHFLVGIGNEAVDGDDRRHAEFLQVLEMPLQVGTALFDGANVFLVELVARNTTVHLQGTHGRHQDHGGGFQAGVIFAAGFILYGLIFGIENARRVLPARVTRVLLAVGVLLFGGTGVVSFFLGHNFLDYSVLLKNSVSGQHLGIFLVELGVGITVSATMITIFYIFASQDK